MCDHTNVTVIHYIRRLDSVWQANRIRSSKLAVHKTLLWRRGQQWWSEYPIDLMFQSVPMIQCAVALSAVTGNNNLYFEIQFDIIRIPNCTHTSICSKNPRPSPLMSSRYLTVCLSQINWLSHSHLQTQLVTIQCRWYMKKRNGESQMYCTQYSVRRTKLIQWWPQQRQIAPGRHRYVYDRENRTLKHSTGIYVASILCCFPPSPMFHSNCYHSIRRVLICTHTSISSIVCMVLGTICMLCENSRRNANRGRAVTSANMWPIYRIYRIVHSRRARWAHK